MHSLVRRASTARGTVHRVLATASLALALATSTFATVTGAPKGYQRPAALELPAPTERTATFTVEQLNAAAQKLEPRLGGYPARIKGDEERAATYREWSGLLQEWRALYRTGGDTESLLSLGVGLHRQGHNLDVKQCGPEALRLLEVAERRFPESESIAWQGSFVYLQMDPKLAPRGEAALLKLRQLRKTERDPQIERGLVFAYLYQRRTDDALRQVEHVLALTPNDQQMTGLRDALKKGAVTFHSGPPPQ